MTAYGNDYFASLGGSGNVNGISRPNTRNFAFFKPNGFTTVNSFGDTPTAPGTGAASAAVAPSAAFPWQGINYASAATLNNQALITGQQVFRWGQRPLFQTAIAPGAAVTLARYYIGLADAAWASLLGGDAFHALGQGAVFRRSTAAGDTNYQCITSNGSASTIVDSGVPCNASEAREFEVSDNGSASVFKIDGAVVASISTTRPVDALLVRMGVGVQTLEAAVKSITWAWLWGESN